MMKMKYASATLLILMSVPAFSFPIPNLSGKWIGSCIDRVHASKGLGPSAALISMDTGSNPKVNVSVQDSILTKADPVLSSPGTFTVDSSFRGAFGVGVEPLIVDESEGTAGFTSYRTDDGFVFRTMVGLHGDGTLMIAYRVDSPSKMTVGIDCTYKKQ